MILKLRLKQNSYLIHDLNNIYEHKASLAAHSGSMPAMSLFPVLVREQWAGSQSLGEATVANRASRRRRHFARL